MKFIVKTFQLLIAVLIVSGPTDLSAQNHWPRDFQNVGDSFFEFGAKAYDRPGDDFGFPVLVDGVTDAVLLDSGDITDLGGAAGAEVRFGWKGHKNQKWEVRSFVVNWDQENAFDQPNLTSPLSPDLDPGQVTLDYNSQIFSIEINRRLPVTPGFTFLIGPRFVSLNEEIEITTDTIVPIPPLPDANVFSENTIETRNPLLGGQIGALINYQVSRDIYFQGFIRAGGYLNFTELRTTADTSLTDETIAVLRRNEGSFIGEVGGKAYIDVIPGLFSGFVGYEATWLDNVALAPAQASSLTPETITTGVTPFFHAVTFGLQFRR